MFRKSSDLTNSMPRKSGGPAGRMARPQLQENRLRIRAICRYQSLLWAAEPESRVPRFSDMPSGYRRPAGGQHGPLLFTGGFQRHGKPCLQNRGNRPGLLVPRGRWRAGNVEYRPVPALGRGRIFRNPGKVDAGFSEQQLVSIHQSQLRMAAGIGGWITVLPNSISQVSPGNRPQGMIASVDREVSRSSGINEAGPIRPQQYASPHRHSSSHVIFLVPHSDDGVGGRISVDFGSESFPFTSWTL